MRIRVEGDQEFTPPCTECGWYAWNIPTISGATSAPDAEPQKSTDPAELAQIISRNLLVEPTEFQEFLKDFNAKQTNFVMERFQEWKDAKAQSEATKIVSEADQQRAMFKAVWEILESTGE